MKKYGILLLTIFLASLLSYAQAPVPFINLPLMPDATTPGGPQFTLTVNGTGFVSNSVVNWNGTPLATQFVSQSQLTTTVPAADIATAGTGWVTVVNPAPGGGTPNTAFFAVTFNTGNSVSFDLASSPGTGFDPISVAVDDFNGDGQLDLAVANFCGSDQSCSSPGTVSVLLGDGTGNFTSVSPLTVGVNPASVAVGDFNGDGKPDLAVANFTDGTVSILLGDGTGNFMQATPVSIAPYSGLLSLAAGDLNRDGKLDLAVVMTGFDQISVLLGDGAGNFTLASSPAVGHEPQSLGIGDFNGDGKLDLAVTGAGSNTVSILLGDGTGNFNLASSPATGSIPRGVALGDFSGDGKLDLVVANESSNTVSVLLGDGTGNFTLASFPPTGNEPFSVAGGDFNGDGKLDLAVGNEDGTVSILQGDGTGNFTLAATVRSGAFAYSVAAADFDRDGRLDFAAANYEYNTLSVLPSSLAFGTELVGTTSSPQQVTLTNTGSERLSLTKVVGSPNFSQTNNCLPQLPPGGHCTANVVFTPRNINTINGTITIYDNAPDSPQKLPLSGVGTEVTLLPSSLDFGDQPVGTSSQPQTVTFTNYAPLAVTIFGGGLTGNSGAFGLSNNTCGNSVPAGSSCTMSVTFTPKYPGPKNATLNVKDNGGASPQTVALSGTGT